MKTAFRNIATMMAICLAVIVVGCSAGVSDNVAGFCNKIDQCTDRIATADNSTEARSELSRYDSELSKYADDTTELTDADRKAVMESLERYVDAMAQAMMADIATTHPRYADTVVAMAKMKTNLLDSIAASLDASRTLGEFVTRSSKPSLTGQNRSER